MAVSSSPAFSLPVRPFLPAWIAACSLALLLGCSGGGSGGGGPEGAPAAPTDLQATASSDSQVELDWSDRSVDESGFEVERSLDGVAWLAVGSTPADVSSKTDGGLQEATTYWYRVRAVNALGPSPYSNQARVTTRSPARARSFGGDGDDRALAITLTGDDGRAVAGYTDSFGTVGVDLWVLRLDEKLGILWERAYGGTLFERAQAITETDSGGLAVTGVTNSFGAGATDVWFLQLDAQGRVLRERTHGGVFVEAGGGMVATADGGFLVAGMTTSFGAGESDGWLLELDAQGDVVWERSYGTAASESFAAVASVSSGGYVAVGAYAPPFGIDVDFWVVRVDAQGSLLWEARYGGSMPDSAASVVEAPDGGFVVVGTESSFRTNSTNEWVVKLDANGAIEWQRSLGAPAVNIAGATGTSVALDGSDGFFVGGHAFRDGFLDVWVQGLSLAGTPRWGKAYAEAPGGELFAVRRDGVDGFALAGGRSKVPGFGDYWVLRVGVHGEIEFNSGSGVQTVSLQPIVVDTTASPVPLGAVSFPTSAIHQDSSATVTVTQARVETQAP